MASRIESTAVFKADITNFRAAMQEAKRITAQAKAEFYNASAGMAKWENNVNALDAKVESLNKQLSAHKRRLEVLKERYKTVTAEEGKFGSGAIRTKTDINNEEAALKNCEAELGRYARKLEMAGGDASDFAAEIAKTNQEVTQSTDGYTVMKGALASLVADGIRLAIDAFREFGEAVFEAGSSFEAGMSEVEAISQATTAEMEQLTAKAVEMGQTTKFTATEAAEGLKYMALAGWDTESMLSGIGGVMDLAAASGEDLGRTSDIVTDALTAMGYSADQSTHLADVLAQTAANSNTTIDKMGETFKYVAPVIGTMGYTMEDAAVATGLMANAGIKGSQAGTTLRSVITRLAAPPKTAAAAIENLGIQMSDANGEMIPMRDLINQLREKFSGLTKEEKAANAKAIAGQYAMAGFLSIVDSTDESVEKLTEAIDHSAGAAAAMADTMMDNVNGQLTLLKSNIESKFIGVFQKAGGKIKSGIKEINGAINDLDWDSIGNGIAELTSQFFGFVTMLINNSGTIISVLKTIGAVMLGVFAVSKYASFLTFLDQVIYAFGSLQSILSVIAATEAGAALASILTPVGLLTTAIGGVTAAIIMMGKAYNDSIEKQYGLSDSMKETSAEIEEAAEKIQSAHEATQESLNNTEGEFDHIERLKDEYDTLIDANGEVKEGYEDRADFIINELCDALGLEREEIEKIVNENGKLGDSIDEIIEKKKAEAILNSYDQEYRQALQEREENVRTLAKAQDDLTNAEKRYNKTKQENKKAHEDADKALKDGKITLTEYNQKILDADLKLRKAKETLAQTRKEFKAAEKNVVDNNTAIENYEKLAEAIESGSTKKIEEAIRRIKDGFVTAETATQEELRSQYEKAKEEYDRINQMYKDGQTGVTKEVRDEFKQTFKDAEEEYEKVVPNWVLQFDKLKKKAKEKGVEIPKAVKKGIEEGSYAVPQSIDELNALIRYNTLVDSAERAGYKIPESISKGIENGDTQPSEAVQLIFDYIDYTKALNDAYNAGYKIPEEISKGVEEGKKKPKDAIDEINKIINKTEGKSEESSRKNGEESGKAYAEMGGRKTKKKAAENAELLATSAKGGFKKLIKTFSDPGEKSGKKYASGVGSKKNIKRANKSGKDNAEAAYKGLGSKNDSTFELGYNFMKGFQDGLNYLKDTIWQGIVSFGNACVEKLKEATDENSPSKATREIGVYFGEGFKLGVDASKPIVLKSVEGLAKSSLSILDNTAGKKQTKKRGQSFSEGLASGIDDTIADVIRRTNETTTNLLAGLGADIVQSANRIREQINQKVYEHGREFIISYVRGIAKESVKLQTAVQNSIGSILKIMRGAKSSYDFTGVAQTAGSVLSDTFAAQVKYMTGKMQYQNEQNLAEMEKTISGLEAKQDDTVSALEKQRDKEVERITKKRDSETKALESERDKKVRAAEKERDKKVSALEKERDRKVAKLQKERDNRVSDLELARDKRIKKLESERDKLSYGKEDSQRRKELTAEIKKVRRESNRKIKQTKRTFKEEIAATKESYKNKIKTTKDYYKQEITALKDAYKGSIAATKARFNEAIEATKNGYNKQIESTKAEFKKLLDTEKANKEAYSRASQEMLSEFSEAMSQYQSKAEELVNGVINSISSKYDALYDELVGKQDNLISKLVSAQDLFEISGAGVMTINDIKKQTETIKTYTDKLSQIKDRVSEELFDKIASFDIKEGSAFMDRLLSMSEQELQEYNNAYTEMLKAANDNAAKLYQSDFEKLANDYSTELEEAFKDLPAQLEELGYECFKGFIEGLTVDTDYMSKNIQVWVRQFVKLFEDELGIASPSKVMMGLGEYTVLGFAEGISSSVSKVGKSVSKMIDETTNIPNIRGRIEPSASRLRSATNTVSNQNVTNNVTNNYNLVQNNTSPKSLTALETYQARRQQISMIKAFA